MTKQERIQAIERIIIREVELKHSYHSIAVAIEEAIGVDEDKIYEMLDGFSYKSPRTGYTKIITLKETSQKMSKAISTNKEVISIKELSND